ncbi:DUF47 domain-containing protein [Kribbella sp. WER1]
MRASRLGRFVGDLLGRSDRQLIGIIGSQLDAAIDGATLAREMAAGGLPADQARSRMSSIEHRGDRERGRMVQALAATLTAPVDREDLFRLSRCIDDVLDNVRDFVRESDLYALDRPPAVVPVLDALIDGLQGLQQASRSLSDGTTAAHVTLGTKKAVGRVRQCYQHELAELFEQPLDMRILKTRELLRRLDVAGLRLGEAADALADGIMKRGR